MVLFCNDPIDICDFLLWQVFSPCATFLWSSWVPLELNLFTKLAMREHLWTADRLARRQLQHLAAYLLCYQEPETHNHLRQQCPFFREVWIQILYRKGFTILPMCAMRRSMNGGPRRLWRCTVTTGGGGLPNRPHFVGNLA